MLHEKIIAAMGMPFACIYGVMILGLMYFVFISIPRTLRTKYWPKADGVVNSIKLNEQKRINNRKATTTLYSTDIEYSYSVNGKEYSSNKIKWVDHRSNNQKLHNSMLDKYPQNAKVKVFYNPKKPKVGLLEPGLSAGNFIGFLFFAIALASMTLVLASKL